MAPASAQQWARDITSEAGLAGHGVGYQWGEAIFTESFASGACWGDYDNDGLIDLYVTDLLDGEGGGRSSLYRNTGVVDGVPRFEDVTEATGTGVVGVGQACLWGDYDSDGWRDLFVTTAVTNFSAQANVLFRNLGGTFEDVSASAGVHETMDPYDKLGCGVAVQTPLGERPGCWSSSSAWIDYDLDGDLDLYVLQYAKFGVGTCKQLRNMDPAFCEGQPNRLYRNDGDRFVEVGGRAGVAFNDQPTGGRSLGVIATDIDGDSWPDLWVANDMDGNALYLNNQNGTFRNAAEELGADNFGPRSRGPPTYRAGMGVDAADIDNDGDLDLLSTHLTGEYDGLWLWTGKTFHDSAREIGIGTEVAHTNSRWGAGLVDMDLDGWKDLLFVTGAPGSGEPGPIHVMHNRGGTFEFAHELTWPFGLGGYANYRGAAFADIDNDGDLDLYASSLPDPEGKRGAKLLLFEVPEAAHRNWVRVDLIGVNNAREAYGARLEVATPDGMLQTYTKASGGSYSGTRDPRILVGLGNQTQAELSVTWPGGGVQKVEVDLAGQQGLEITIVEETSLSPARATPDDQHDQQAPPLALGIILAAPLAAALASRRLSAR